MTEDETAMYIAAEHLPEAATAQDRTFHGQAAPLVVGEVRPSGTVYNAENPILFEQVINDRLLLPVDPPGDKKDEERERGRQRVHREACPSSRPGARSAMRLSWAVSLGRGSRDTPFLRRPRCAHIRGSDLG